jgi:hypothetical protein
VSTLAERAPSAPEVDDAETIPVDGPFINGARVCRALLVMLAVAQVAYAFGNAVPYFVLLAAACVAAAFINVRNLRTVIAGLAEIEAMYFLSSTLAPHQPSVLHNLVFFGAALLVTGSVLYLRSRESALPVATSSRQLDSLRPWRWVSGNFGLLLVVSASILAFAPVTTSEVSTPISSTQCGSVLLDRHLTHGWSSANLPLLSDQCEQARSQRTAFAFLMLELGLGAIWFGRNALLNQRRRFPIIAVAVVILGGGASAGWTSASVSNANNHNRDFAPWFDRFGDNFALMATSNSQLSQALNKGNAGNVNAACKNLQTVAQNLQPSVTAWPSAYAADRSAWKRFVDQYQADAGRCVATASSNASADDLKASEWFTDSSTSLAAVKHTVSYW